MIRCEQHVAAVDIRHLLDDLIQLVEGIFHSIKSFLFRFSRITGIVNHVVENINHLVIAHQGPAIRLRVQFQKIIGRYRGGTFAARYAKNLLAVRRAGSASPIHARITVAGSTLNCFPGNNDAMPNWV